jgi:16S rRNA (guanine527-N7)-methyltransferase
VSAAQQELRRVLEDARAAGFLGPGPVEAHLAHAVGFAEAAEASLGRAPGDFCDLGTGGGVPGLVLALRWDEAEALLVDSNERRSAALREAVARLGLGDRVGVLEQRAEIVGRPGPYRERYELVTARSFAGPGATAEIASGILGMGGYLVVSEPPVADPTRWSADGLESLGLGPPDRLVRADAHFAVLRKTAETPPRFPRGIGKPGKRPLW